MRKAVNNCVCCALPCVNCGRRHEEVFICDNCEEEKDVLYLYDNKEICEGCLKAKLISEFIISNSNLGHIGIFISLNITTNY